MFERFKGGPSDREINKASKLAEELRKEHRDLTFDEAYAEGEVLRTKQDPLQEGLTGAKANAELAHRATEQNIEQAREKVDNSLDAMVEDAKQTFEKDDLADAYDDRKGNAA